MKSFKCPKCKEASISPRDKYRAGIWKIIFCPHCGARLCGNPVLMALAYMLYVWAFAWFIFWALLEHTWLPLLYLLPVWLLLDFLNLRLMPLSVMRPRKTEDAAQKPRE